MLLWKVSGKSRMIKGGFNFAPFIFLGTCMSVSLVFMYFAILYMKIYEMKRHILFILTLLLFFMQKVSLIVSLLIILRKTACLRTPS